MTDRSDLTQRIADILAQHRYLSDGECSCGHDSTSHAPENWAYHQDRHHDPHVAEQIVNELGVDLCDCRVCTDFRAGIISPTAMCEYVDE